MKRVFLIILVIAILLISGCSGSTDTLIAEDLTQEQQEALMRLDPEGCLTEHRAIFDLTREEILGYHFDNKKNDSSGNAWVEQYYSCAEPITLGYVFKGDEKLSGVVYTVGTNVGNTNNAIENFSDFLYAVRNDLITVYGTEYTENMYQGDYTNFDECISQLETGESVYYRMQFLNGSYLYFAINMENTLIKTFDIQIALVN